MKPSKCWIKGNTVYWNEPSEAVGKTRLMVELTPESEAYITALEARVKMAEEVIEFYSDVENFYWAQTDQDNIYMLEGAVKDNPCSIDKHEKLGKRARAYQSKYMNGGE